MRSNGILKVGFLLLLVAVQSSLFAQQGQVTEFFPYSEYRIRIDGAVDNQARIYRSAQPPAIAIVSGLLSSAVVLRPQTYKVESLSTTFLMENGENLKVTAGQTPHEVGRFSIGKTTVDFDFEGHKMSLSVRPQLLKQQTAADLQAFDKIYATRAEEYTVDPEFVRIIDGFPAEATVTVYFGSWCPHCQLMVPRVIKLAESLSGPVQIEYYGVPNQQGGPPDPIVNDKKIEKLPTAVVTLQGQEVGRIVGNEFEKPEVKLSEILFAEKQKMGNR